MRTSIVVVVVAIVLLIGAGVVVVTLTRLHIIPPAWASMARLLALNTRAQACASESGSGAMIPRRGNS